MYCLHIDRERFERARQDAGERQKEGIGTMGEKLLHATLKNYFSGEEDLQEQKIGRYIADISGPDGVVEIQTGSYAALKKKLPALLKEHPVTVVYPLMRKKTVFWIDPQTGEVTKGRKSPKEGKPYDALPELFYLSEFCGKENFRILLFFYDGEEYRRRDGWGREGKKGAHRVERIPLLPVDLLLLSDLYDYGALLPPSCPTTFTGNEFSKLTAMKGRRLWAALKFLVECDVLSKERKGRTCFYTVHRKEFVCCE